VVDIGDTLAGKYRVERVLGRGGMGYVVAARHNQLDQQVAIKILMPELCENEDAVARFLREARASVRIQNEHIARVLDVGTLDDGAPYMVMEFLEGRDVAKELEERHRLPIREAVDYILQAGEALAEAHALGIVHRDLKPANLFRTRRSDGSVFVKVLDFGISKALVPDAKAVSLTSTQGLIGSPFYMSPEQVRKPKTVDTRSDIWSLGVILHELLSGSPPFTSDTPLSILAAVVTDPPPPIRTVRDDVPVGLEAVILKCLEKEPTRRFADIAEMAHALKPYAPENGATAVARISAIARSAKERANTGGERPASGSDTPTLESRRPHLDTPTLESPRGSPNRELKETDAGWGHSKEIAGRSRRRLAVAGLGAAMSMGAAWLAWRSFASPATPEASIASPHPDLADNAEPPNAPAANVAAPNTAPPPSVVTNVASATANSPDPVVADGSARSTSAASNAPSTTIARPPPFVAKRPPPKNALEKTSSEKTAPSGHPPLASEPGVDPLDGRR
jgi:serine/threonine-protein kinase